MQKASETSLDDTQALDALVSCFRNGEREERKKEGQQEYRSLLSKRLVLGTLLDRQGGADVEQCNGLDRREVMFELVRNDPAAYQLTTQMMNALHDGDLETVDRLGAEINTQVSALASKKDARRDLGGKEPASRGNRCPSVSNANVKKETVMSTNIVQLFSV